MLTLAQFVLSVIGPVPIDLATVTPDRAAGLTGQLVEVCPTLGPRIGVFGKHLGHDHASADGTCRTVWTPAGEKVGRVLVGKVEVIEHVPAGQFPGFIEIRFTGRVATMDQVSRR